MSKELAGKDSAQSDPRLAERLTALEMVVTHLERTIHDLDEAIRARSKGEKKGTSLIPTA